MKKYFFNCYLATPWSTLDHYWGDSLMHLMLISAFLHFQPKGHLECCNEVRSLIPAEGLVGFEPKTFQLWLQCLNPLGFSPLTLVVSIFWKYILRIYFVLFCIKLPICDVTSFSFPKQVCLMSLAWEILLPSLVVLKTVSELYSDNFDQAYFWPCNYLQCPCYNLYG